MADDNSEVASVPFLLPLKAMIDRKPKRVAIFTHAHPDPDAVGGVMALGWLLAKYGIESHGFYSGPVSHPQNAAMINLLEPDLRPIDLFKPEEYDTFATVDAVPSNAGIGGHHIKFDLVIDHHKESVPPDFNGVLINLKAGSTCGTLYEVICRLQHQFDDEVDADVRVATAILIGISTDTENLMSDDSTEYEFTAWADLFGHRSPTALRKIVNFDRPKSWVRIKAESILNSEVQDGVAIVGMGLIGSKDRDVISDLSQEMVAWEGVDTAIAFALIDGDRIEGSVRSKNVSLPVSTLCKTFGGKHGCGGGKLGKGAYRYGLAGGGFDEEDSVETKKKTWELFAEKEKARLRRLLNK